jgi:4-hydroxybenzoate polyprenyltransferase
MNTTKVIFSFIKERFPIHILTFTTLSSILASMSVISGEVYSWQILIAFTVTTLLLFHIRVIDERRDYDNDTLLHPERPVQQGVISLKNLFVISICGLAFSMIMAVYLGGPAWVIIIVFIGFTTFAAFDFLSSGYFKNKPVIYHIVNSPQMILLQWMIFAFISWSLKITFPMFLLMLLIYINIFIMEVVRKVKISAEETADTYSAILGMKKSIFFLIALVICGFIVYGFLLHEIAPRSLIFLLLGGMLSLCTIGVYLLFFLKQKKLFQDLMKLTSVLLYVFMNLLVYFAG